MHFERLTKRESTIIGEVLRAVTDGPFFPDWENFKRCLDSLGQRFVALLTSGRCRIGR
jgi:hypothetical protein